MWVCLLHYVLFFFLLPTERRPPPPLAPAGFTDICTSTRWLEISTSLLASMYHGKGDWRGFVHAWSLTFSPSAQVYTTSPRPCPSGRSGQPWQWVHCPLCSSFLCICLTAQIIFTLHIQNEKHFHALMILLSSLTAYNFSHRIDHLSFGEAIPGIISPLDGTEKISTDGMSVLSMLSNFSVNNREQG